MFILSAFIFLEKLLSKVHWCFLDFSLWANTEECASQDICSLICLPPHSSPHVMLTCSPWELGLTLSPFEYEWTCVYSGSDREEVIKNDITSSWASWGACSWNPVTMLRWSPDHMKWAREVIFGHQCQQRSQPADSISHQVACEDYFRWFLSPVCEFF